MVPWLTQHAKSSSLCVNCLLVTNLGNLLKGVDNKTVRNKEFPFSNFSCMFLNPNDFFSILIIIVLIYYLDMRNLQEQVKTTFCYQKLFWPFTVWINCSSDLKLFANSRPSATNFKSFSRSIEQFFLKLGQNKNHPHINDSWFWLWKNAISNEIFFARIKKYHFGGSWPQQLSN